MILYGSSIGQCLGPPIDKGESIIRENESDEDDYPTPGEENASLIKPEEEDPDDVVMRETFKQCVVTVTIPDSVSDAVFYACVT